MSEHHDDERRPADLRRRQALGAIGSLSLIGLFGCGGGGGASDEGDSAGDDTVTDGSDGTDGTTGGSGDGGTQVCVEAPEETAGPYPADGSTASNRTYNVLALAGIVRSDIRSSIDGSGTQDGVPLTLNISLGNTQDGCASLEGYAIYIWHCTRAGDYSVYTTGNVAENYLRGVQATDASGKATFVTVVPGCYMGRVPHIHVEIYPSLALAKSAANAVKTTQLAFPADTMEALYRNVSSYADSVRAFESISFATDNVFSDGYDSQLVTMSGNVSDGYTAAIDIAIAA